MVVKKPTAMLLIFVAPFAGVVKVQIFVKGVRTVAVPAGQIVGSQPEKTIVGRPFQSDAAAPRTDPRIPLVRIVAGRTGNIAHGNGFAADPVI